jgi:DNA (cytosine-5)-methyltransferase 1
MSPSFASLYCGCGGFDLGFIQAGYRCLGAFDIDPLAIQVHNSNLESHASICNLSTESLSIEKFKGLDVLLAGSPCQGFSTVGKRDFDDPRNSLLVNGGRIAVAIRPKIFIAENVAGVIAGDHKRYWESLHEILRAADYHTAEAFCDAHLMGIPQRRRRMIMIAWKGSSDVSLTLPRIDGGAVAKALHSINGAANHFPSALPVNSHLKLIANHIHQGQKLSNVRCGPLAVHTWQIPEVFGRTTAPERVLATR